MKCKRILSMLLTLCMVMSLFAGTTVTASAAEDTAPTGCTHQHDGSCGYVEAVAEVPCAHVHDENCGGLMEEPPEETEPQLSEELASLQERINALPTGEQYRAMTADEQDAVYEKAAGISDEYFDLSEEERALVDITALEELFAVMNEDVALLTGGGDGSI